MRVAIEKGPSNTVARCTFAAGDKMTAEGGSMVTMHASIDMETTTQNRGKGRVIKGIKRMLGGESFFLNHYSASKDDTEVILSPTLNGDIFRHELNNSELIIQGGSYLGHYGDVGIDASWQGVKNVLSGENFFWINASGTGTVLGNAFGMIYCVEVDGEYIVDTGHAVAFEKSLNYELTKVGKNWFKSILGGEGVVLKFSGKGKVWCQSHNKSSFGHLLGPKLRPR